MKIFEEKRSGESQISSEIANVVTNGMAFFHLAGRRKTINVRTIGVPLKKEMITTKNKNSHGESLIKASRAIQITNVSKTAGLPALRDKKSVLLNENKKLNQERKDIERLREEGLPNDRKNQHQH